MNSLLQDILNGLKLLISLERREGDEARKQDALNGVLQSNINKLLEFLQSNEKLAACWDISPANVCIEMTDENVRWIFVEWILKLLKFLSCELCKSHADDTDSCSSDCAAISTYHLNVDAPPLSAGVLSLSQKKLVTAAFEFVVIFGICPFLLPGVEIAIKHRAELACLMKTPNIPPVKDQESHLLVCVNSLLSHLEQPQFADILLSRYVGDILAVLIQLVYAKKTVKSEAMISKPLNDKAEIINKKQQPNFEHNVEIYSSDSQSGEQKQELTTKTGHVTPGCCDEKHPLSVNDSRIYFSQKLDEFIERIPPTTLIRELLILQAGPTTQHSATAVCVTRAKSPVWLKKACRSFILRTVSKPGGVFVVFSGLLQNEVQGDYRKCDASARIVHDCYQNLCSVEQHYNCLAPQLVQLLKVVSSGALLRATVSVASLMFSCQPVITEQLVIEPLLTPLYLCLDTTDISHDEAEFVDEDALTRCLETVHKVFVLNCEPLCPLIAGLKPVVDVLFQLYRKTRQSITTNKREPLSAILHRILASQDVATTVTYLHQLSFGGYTSFKQVSKQLQFVTGDNGGLKVISAHNRDIVDDEDWNTVADAVVELIMPLQQQADVVAEFFLSCLEELTHLISSKDEDLFAGSSAESGSSCLLEIDARIAKAESMLRHNLLLLGMISVLCDRLEQQCLKNTTHIIKFARVTLERSMKLLKSTEEDLFGAFENETLLMAMGLLTTIMTDEDLCKKIEWNETDNLLPLLKYFGETYPDLTVRQIAFNLQVAVATRGRVQVAPELSADCVTNSDAINSSAINISNSASARENGCVANESRPLIEVISDKSADTENIKSKDISAAKSFHEAMELMKDPSVPTQGHAILCLRRLVESGDKNALESRDVLFNLCLDNVTHSDSYIYLYTVQLLAALVVKFPQSLLPRLIKEYVSDNSSSTGCSEISAECRMKLGEVLVKTSAALGPLVPQYRDVLVGSCLCAARDKDPLIRASAMSNLGQVCQHLHFSLGRVMFEVFECIQALIKSDSHVEVRRAAAVSATLLLRGLSKDSLKILGGDLMQNFYRMLKQVNRVEADDIVRVHVQLALDEIDIFMKEFIFPRQNFTKRIHILDSPNID